MTMEDVGIGLNRPTTFPLETLEKMLVGIGDVDIGTRPATLTTITQVTMLYCCVYLVLLVMLMILLMKMKELIVVLMSQDVEVGLNRSYTITSTMMEEVLMVT